MNMYFMEYMYGMVKNLFYNNSILLYNIILVKDISWQNKKQLNQVASVFSVY